jgi:predicted enzyme related to lactoylglutathione lyase
MKQVSKQGRLVAATPWFTVRDVVATAEHYRDALGFSIAEYRGEPPTFAMVSRDGVDLYLDQGARPGSHPGRRGYDAYLHVDDAAAMADEFRARGAHIVEGPIDREDGRREFVVADPNGLRLAFGQDLGTDRWTWTTPTAENSIVAIHPYKIEGIWVFDDERVGLVQEPFVSGADTAIDRLTEHIDGAEDGFALFFSGTPFPGQQIEFEWQREELGGNWYRSRELGLEGWLCPALFKYFRAAPARIYVRAAPRAH